MKWPFTKRSVSESEHDEALMQERLRMAAEWLKRMPRFPPNCERLRIVMKYDDGRQLDMEVGQSDV